MEINFYTDQPQASEALVAHEKALHYNGGTYQGASLCRCFLENIQLFLQADKLLLPLAPTLDQVCMAYLCRVTAQSGKPPKASDRLCDFLESEVTVPLTRASLDTLPMLHACLQYSTTDEKAARIMLDRCFDMLRQAMMNLILYPDYDILLAPITTHVPSLAGTLSSAEADFDKYVLDCKKGTDTELSLPMEDGSVVQRHVLTLQEPRSPRPALFAAMSGFALLVVTRSDGTTLHPLDCSKEALLALFKQQGRNVPEGVFLPGYAGELAPAFDALACRSCHLSLTIYFTCSSPRRLTTAPAMLAGYQLEPGDMHVEGRNCTITYTHRPALEGTHFLHALQKTLEIRTALLDSHCNSLPIFAEQRAQVCEVYCDGFLSLPRPQMLADFLDTAAYTGGQAAFLADGMVCICDQLPPVGDLRMLMRKIDCLENRHINNSFAATSVLAQALALAEQASESQDFVRAGLDKTGAQARIETVRLRASHALDYLNKRAGLLSIVVLSVVLTSVLTCLPFVLGLLKITSALYMLPILLIIAGVSALLTYFLLRNKTK